MRKPPKWTDINSKIADIDDHYSMREDQHKLLFEYAIKVPRGGTILELGVAHGKTSAMFSLIAKAHNLHYYGIDDFSLEGTQEEVEDHFKRLGTVGTIIKSRTQDFDWNQQVDLLFIDAGHDEENIKADCEKYVPFVKPGGVVIFDDWAIDETRNDPHWAVGYYGTIATEGWESLDDSIYIRAFRRQK